MNLTQRILSVAAVALFPVLSHAGAVDQLHDFLKNTKTLKAEFAQAVIAKSGRKPQQSSGVVAISRPGKLRWEIQKPYPQLVVGDGEKIWIHDPELQQVTVRKAGQAIGGSPAALLSGSNELEKNFTLKDVGEAEGLNWVEATPKVSDSGFERVRLGFSGGDLKAMELLDSFGQTTLIRFSKMERNPSLPATTFKFTPPAGADVVGE
ncbi:outer membrane lipoprotein chaperone LolA [Dechloromonas sp. XY25]|uniref:Outer-membrane lipoprotein carrier protein n=1 Tax=Dechloromonas hankyongensis TaxID=2908002 RepID=A0ABS9K225_9RHOO|nr:outer membrane lipoprotein chaperone LolA [Dechloromonas hankyongensis]MCG2577134.1 outer membrane lipoprotein chaperone LolA [Dechloromonas hankyongensis]